MITIRSFFFSLLFLLSFFAKAQTHNYNPAPNDAQLWENIYFEKNVISKKYIAHLNQEGRFTENLSQFRYSYADLGLTYKFKKWLRFSADYVFLYKKALNNNSSKTFNSNLTDLRNSFRHQVYFDFVLRKKIGNITLSDRNMFQWEWDDPQTTLTGNVSMLYIRNKLAAKYNTGGGFSPYLAEEQYYSLVFYDKYGDQFDRSRYYIGCFYALDAVNEFEAYYMIERRFNVNAPQVNWVIGIGFSHSFYSGGLMGKW